MEWLELGIFAGRALSCGLILGLALAVWIEITTEGP